jgi:type IV pilus assembly protein PilA
MLLFACAADLNSPEFRAAETEAIRDIQRIHQAETQYFSRHERYATSLGALTPLEPIAPREKYGYLFSLAVSPNGYEVHATPKVFGTAGRRTFYSNETMTIRQNWGPAPAGPQSPELK